jgi:hypothetical protein
MSILFKDIAKQANDLLSSSNYTTGGAKKFSISTKAANGAKYKAEANISGGSVSGKIATELKHDSGFTVKKLELNNKGTLTTQITLDKALDNFQFSVDAKIQPLAASNPKEDTRIGATYTHKDFKANLKVSPLDPTAADLSVCFNRDEFYFGGAAGLTLDDNSGAVDFSAYDFGLAYKQPDAVAAFTVTQKLSQYQFSFFHKHSDKINFAAKLDGKTTPKDAGAAGIEFGGSYKIDNDTTAYSKLSLPNSNTASASFSFNVNHKLNDSATLDFTSVLPVDLTGAPEFGLNMSFGI